MGIAHPNMLALTESVSIPACMFDLALKMQTARSRMNCLSESWFALADQVTVGGETTDASL